MILNIFNQPNQQPLGKENINIELDDEQMLEVVGGNKEKHFGESSGIPSMLMDGDKRRRGIGGDWMFGGTSYL